MTRNIAWVQDLHDYLVEKRSEPFKWGAHDCCLFVTGAIMAMTGVQVNPWVGSYTDLNSALVAIEATTGEPSIESGISYIVQAHGLESCPVLMARRGDVLFFEDVGEGQPALMLVGLDGLNAVGVGESGLTTLPVSRAAMAWRI